jgi:hypothetical protein
MKVSGTGTGYDLNKLDVPDNLTVAHLWALRAQRSVLEMHMFKPLMAVSLFLGLVVSSSAEASVRYL